MRILKIKIPFKTLLDLGLPNHFEFVNHLEVLQIYQYESKFFFAMYKIIFKKEKMGELYRYIQDFCNASTFQILEQNLNEILCIMKQKNIRNFLPELPSSSFALIPPLILDPTAVVFSLIISAEDQLNRVMKQLKMFNSFHVLSITNLDEKTASSMKTMPTLTSRQKEIMRFATRRGYFNIPKKISTQQIAEHFQVSTSAILTHVQKAEKTIMQYFFD